MNDTIEIEVRDDDISDETGPEDQIFDSATSGHLIGRLMEWMVIRFLYVLALTWCLMLMEEGCVNSPLWRILPHVSHAFAAWLIFPVTRSFSMPDRRQPVAYVALSLVVIQQIGRCLRFD